MSDQTDVAPQRTPIQRVAALLESDEAKSKLSQALAGLNVSPERFTRTALAALAASPFVVERCSAGSIVAAILRAATLRLELDPALGQAYIVPRRDQATLQIGARGWVDLAHRTGRLVAIDVGDICENDVVDYVRGTAPRLDVRPPIGKPRGKPLAYYCAAQWRDGGSTVEVMSVEEIHAIRDAHSEEWQRRGPQSVWGKHPQEMAKKTVVSRARKTWPVAITAEGADDDSDVRIVGLAPAPAAITADAPPPALPAPDVQVEPQRRRQAPRLAAALQGRG